MTDVLAGEWIKARSVRSTTAILAACAAILAVGAVLTMLMVRDWDGSPPDVRARFANADTSVVALPLAQFCLAALSALVITSEYGSGMIRTSLVAVPRRRTVFAAKALVVAAVTLVAGQAVAFAAFAAGRLIVGDRPPPLGFATSAADALPGVVGAGLSMTTVGLVALGVGAVLRSTAGSLMVIGALLFVLPTLAPLLPQPWDDRAAAAMLPSLAFEVTGGSGAAMSPTEALVAVVYVVGALAAGAVAITRRDA